MPGYPCCCSPTIVNNCTELWDWLATKTEIEVTIESVGRGSLDCTTADCQAVVDGTYILTKIAGSFGSSTCASEGSGRTFAYTFPSSRTIDCTASDDPYLAIAVDFSCNVSNVVYMRFIFKYTGGCSVAYAHAAGAGISLPADLSSGTVPPGSPGSFNTPCEPTSADMPFAFV